MRETTWPDEQLQCVVCKKTFASYEALLQHSKNSRKCRIAALKKPNEPTCKFCNDNRIEWVNGGNGNVIEVECSMRSTKTVCVQPSTLQSQKGRRR